MHKHHHRKARKLGPRQFSVYMQDIGFKRRLLASGCWPLVKGLILALRDQGERPTMVSCRYPL